MNVLSCNTLLLVQLAVVALPVGDAPYIVERCVPACMSCPEPNASTVHCYTQMGIVTISSLAYMHAPCCYYQSSMCKVKKPHSKTSRPMFQVHPLCSPICHGLLLMQGDSGGCRSVQARPSICRGYCYYPQNTLSALHIILPFSPSVHIVPYTVCTRLCILRIQVALSAATPNCSQYHNLAAVMS